ncbi:GDSL-type esterase/lipase family protein [Maribacter arenosus]|uniref:G-D-S-L family lipolytic protein n=1 Tax=Maribacter arenosus TaxID=1854708 RepID=A0ABR7VCH2_9FLAO|nr:GDSL-type esterase/lipase family protein [Maribacter arenosus]MBD0851016.1 G-D-S-L family lipolytic protein [Maribacter arenosus]
MRFLVLLPFIFVVLKGNSQSPERFANEVAEIQKKYDTLREAVNETIVFVGSSSIRTWEGLEENFPDHEIINSGFGGSHASDLLAYCDELILKYNPSKVFIYEGDNDLAEGKKPKEIINTIMEINHRIHAKNKDTQIILISVKPSIARWPLKRKYKRLNRKFHRLSQQDDRLYFANIWNPMLLGRKLNPDLYLEDGLHINIKGYEIWHTVLKPFVDH